MELTIEYLPKEQLKPYIHNAKTHPASQVEQIKKSIEEFGFNDPIAVWGEEEIVEGHGRLLAVMEMPEITTVPVIRLDHLNDEQKRAYALVHNKLTMNSDFDFELLQEELDAIDLNMADFGFETFLEELEADTEDLNPYSQKVKIPQYEPTGADVKISDMVNTDKVQELINEINNYDVDDDIKKFLIEAAHRHTVFNYKNIAEYYANANPRVQYLMEKSALVIIDIDDAIAYGYAKLSSTIEEMIEEENG